MNFWLLWISLIGVYLIWRKTGWLRLLGLFMVLMLPYYQLHWTSPWYVVRGADKVQEFNRKDFLFGRVVYVKWMQDSNRLLIVRNEDVLFNAEQYKYALVVDLEAKKSQWQPIATLNLAATEKVESLNTGYGEQRNGLSLYYASPSKKGPRVESSSFGFSLPVLGYQIPSPFGEITGWQWHPTYFGWKHKVVREYDSGPILVELNQIVLNDERQSYGATNAWVMEGKFLIFEPAVASSPRVMIFGPFNTSQTTQSTTNSKNQ